MAEAPLEVAPEVLEAEALQVAVIERLTQQTVAVFDMAGQGGGSGVLISSDGYALTNFHVTASGGPAMKCGLADGRLYDAVLVGLDPPGDVALIKLLGRTDFSFAELGDSDAARMGDKVYVLGNPFLLADDYQPTVTYGILSGTHRYQYPSGTLLEYADCLQTDASINPGNSGGPLFDHQGRLIGINGRGSFEKRGRVNVGVGYAISINQIKRFLSHLKAGRVVDHATLGATVTSEAGGRVAVDDIIERSDAYRRGLRYGDHLLRFADRDLVTANALKNVLGTYPSGWRVPIEFRREEKFFNATVRLASLHAPGELEALIEEEEAKEPVPIKPPGPEEPKKKKGRLPKIPKLPKIPGMPEIPGMPKAPKKPELPKAVKAVYEKRAGYANYWFNRQHQQRLAKGCSEWSSWVASEPLVIAATDSQGQAVRLVCEAAEGEYQSSQGHFRARFTKAYDSQVGPPGSGGLLAAVSEWRRLLSQGTAGFGEAFYFGQLPFGPDNKLCDCLVTFARGVKTHFYFDLASGHLIGMELFATDDQDPCEVTFSDFVPAEAKGMPAETKGAAGDRTLPMAWKVRQGDTPYVEFRVDTYSQEPKATKNENENHTNDQEATE